MWHFLYIYAILEFSRRFQANYVGLWNLAESRALQIRWHK